jgi:4-hydroxy-2-oxoheptanedioate aldolase
MQLTNPIKAKLRAGERVLGCFVPIPSPEIVEICALAGFDFVLLDAEHGPISPESAYPMILAAEARGCPTIARIGQLDRQVILKFLDIGIAGVMIPQVTTAEAAEAAVAATQFAPRGTRGLAGGRSFGYGMTQPAAELVPALNERVLTLVQCEHVDSVDNLDAILRTPGLDVLFVGPNDLAQSMGYPGQPNHPDVVALVDEKVIPLAKQYGVALGTVAPDGPSALATFERGFDLVGGNAPGLLAGAARAMVQAARG